jgi:ABC-type phosphate transport system substrate-binding protein
MTKTILALCLLMGITRLDAQVAVIGNKSVPVDSIAKIALVDLYLLDVTKWGDGSPAIVKDLKQKGVVRDGFYDYLGKSSSRLKTIWMGKMLTGELDPPEALRTEEEMLSKVAATPGAIGFLSLTKTNDSVKVLLIIN